MSITDHSREGNPAITDWCPKCRTRVVSDDRGRCGWCSARTRPMTQPLDALTKANRRRLAMAGWKQDISRMGVGPALNRVADLLEDPPDDVAAMRAHDLLMAVPTLGAVKVTALLGLVKVRNPQVRIRQLTVRQRTTLAVALRTRYVLGQARQDDAAA